VLLQEFGNDFVFAMQLGFELLDLFVLGILGGLGFAAVVERRMAILKERLEPAIKQGGRDICFASVETGRTLRLG
jgi:hypothetical protein